MSTSTRQTEVTLDTDVPIIRVVREFDAPPAKVFRAHTEPDLLLQWYGPEGTRTTIEHHDPRPGGSYRYAHGYEDSEFVMRGCFHIVRAPELIVQTESMDDGDDVMLSRLVLTDLGGRTRMTVTMLVESFGARDAIVATGMEHGMRESYERLDEVLAR
jgi:uncharacterized protein YndB with AHSA1/START domain